MELTTVEDKVDRLEALFGQFMAQTNRALIRMEKGMEQLQTEMSEFKTEMSEFKNMMENEAKRVNKTWGDLANKMGTIVEDIVAPAIPKVAKEMFGCEDIEDFMVRRYKRKPTDKSSRREFDVIAICNNKVILNETKSTPRTSYLEDFIKFFKDKEFFEYFPEYKEKELIAIFSSLYLPIEVVNRLSKNGIFAMAMSDSVMSILNYEEVMQRS